LSTKKPAKSERGLDFDLKPLRSVAAGLLGSERVVLLADRPDFPVPYRFELQIPAPGEEGRARGLELLWARVVSITTAVVGTSQLRVHCRHAETFDHIMAAFNAHPGVLQVLEPYGPLRVTRLEDLAGESEEERRLPFVGRLARETGSCGLPDGDRLYLGVDFGRSDVKVAVLDGAGQVVSTYVTRWWLLDGGERRYVDPQALTSHEQHLACLAEAALAALKQCPAYERRTICGLGLSAAGCVQGGRLMGVPPAFGGVDRAAAAGVLSRLECALLDLVRERAAVTASCATLLVNDGDASALYGAAGLGASDKVGLFLSCGTGLAGGIVCGGRCCDGVLEVGKLIVGLRRPGSSGIVPRHDGMGVEGAAQGLAGTQRSFFNLLAARGGERIEGKAEQRAALVAMQKRELDDEVRDIFEQLGFWLAQFVLELMTYLPCRIQYLEAGGKLTDGPSGTVLLESAAEVLRPHGVLEVRRAADSEFGQAAAMAEAVRHTS